MTENPDKNRHSKVTFSSEKKDASAPSNHASRSIASTDLRTPGGANPTGGEKAASQPPAQHQNSSNPSPHNTEKSGKKAKGITSITVNAPASKPVAVKPFRELDPLRSRFMKSVNEDLNHALNGRRNPDFSQYRDSSYGITGTQAIPYHPINNSHQSYFNEYPPTALTGSPSRFRHAVPYYYSSAPTPTGSPKVQDGGKLEEKYEEVNRLRQELKSLREGASKRDKERGIALEESAFRRTQPDGKQPKGEFGESSKSREVELLMEQLSVERNKNLLEDLKYTVFQQDLEKEFEDDYQQRFASALAEEKERLVREAEARQATQKDILAKLEADKQAQEDLQKVQLDAIQSIMEKLGNQIVMMQQRESERQAEEERKKEKKELRKRQQEMKKKQREMEEQCERAEQLQREEQRQKEEQQRVQEEEEIKEQRKMEEQMEMEEKMREKERLQKLEQEALQRLRDDWARQQALERKKEAETERLRLEQKEKEQANLEAMERLRETIRAEERERIREEERKQEEDQRQLQEALEEEQRKKDNKTVAKDTQRQIEEGVQKNLSEKLRSEIERLQDDLRRRAWGAQPDFVKGITVSLPKPEILYRPQPRLEWDRNWKFPSSNPFSERHRQVSRSQQQEPRYLEDPSQFPGFKRESLFGDANEHIHWTYDDGKGPAVYSGESGPGQRSGWQNEGSSAASTPALSRGNSQFGDDGIYEADGHGVYSQNPYISPQQQSHATYQVPIAQSETSGSNLDDTQSEYDHSTAFLNSNNFHGMHGANQYPPEVYMSGYNRANTRVFQHTSSPDDRPRAPNFNYRNVFDAGAETNGKGQMMYASYMPGHKSETSEGSTEYRLNEANWAGGREYAETNHNFGRQRPRTQQKSTHPPPSVPTPPAESPLQPAHGRPSKGDPVLNTNGHFPNNREAAKGFPPSLITQQILPVQYLRLDQGATLGVFQSVPVFMVPVISVCSMHLDQPTTVPQGTPGKAAES